MVEWFDADGRAPYPVVMLDPILRRHAEPLLAPLTDRLAAWGVRPDAVTLAAFIAAVGAMADIRYGHDGFALALLVVAGVLDGLDGPLARKDAVTGKGAYLDRVLGLLASAGIPFAFALAEPDRALAALFLELGLVARAAAETAAARAAGQAGQVLSVVGGLVGKSALFVAFALACIFPQWFSTIAYAVGILCFVGAGSQVAAVMVEAP